MHCAALLGLGGAGSTWLLADDLAQGRLVHLAPAWRATPLPVRLTCPHARWYLSRLLQFVTLLRDAVRA